MQILILPLNGCQTHFASVTQLSVNFEHIPRTVLRLAGTILRQVAFVFRRTTCFTSNERFTSLLTKIRVLVIDFSRNNEATQGLSVFCVPSNRNTVLWRRTRLRTTYTSRHCNKDCYTSPLIRNHTALQAPRIRYHKLDYRIDYGKNEKLNTLVKNHILKLQSVLENEHKNVTTDIAT